MSLWKSVPGGRKEDFPFQQEGVTVGTLYKAARRSRIYQFVIKYTRLQLLTEEN